MVKNKLTPEQILSNEFKEKIDVMLKRTNLKMYVISYILGYESNLSFNAIASHGEIRQYHFEKIERYFKEYEELVRELNSRIELNKVFRTKKNTTGLTITGYLGDSKNLIIPSELNNVAVTIIGKESFSGKCLMSVIIPESVTMIASGAFRDNNLENVIVPGINTKINHSAFDDNSFDLTITTTKIQ